MHVIGPDRVRELAPMPGLIAALADAFGGDIVAPPRQILPIPGGGGSRQLLTMPAFDPAGAGMVKLSTIFPDNAVLGAPTIQGAIVAFSDCGTPEALIDGATVTRLRTGATSALASRFLSRADSSHLLLVGTGALAPAMAAAHAAVRPIERISVWGRRPGQVAAGVREVATWVGSAVEVLTCDDLEAAAGRAQIVCCATSAAEPVVLGRWLRPGVHLDLVGSFSPENREVDDQAVLQARIFVDTSDGALAEAGDLLQPLRRGIINPDRIEGALADLVHGRVAGRRDDSEVTLFKSVGTAIADLAACRLILSSAAAGQ